MDGDVLCWSFDIYLPMYDAQHTSAVTKTRTKSSSRPSPAYLGTRRGFSVVGSLGRDRPSDNFHESLFNLKEQLCPGEETTDGFHNRLLAVL